VKKNQAIDECFACIWFANLFENGAKIAHKIREKSSLKGPESGACLGSLFAKRHIKMTANDAHFITMPARMGDKSHKVFPEGSRVRARLGRVKRGRPIGFHKKSPAKACGAWCFY